MGLCWQMPKFIIWRLWSIYFDHHLPLKPSIGKRRKQSCTSNTFDHLKPSLTIMILIGIMWRFLDFEFSSNKRIISELVHTKKQQKSIKRHGFLSYTYLAIPRTLNSLNSRIRTSLFPPFCLMSPPFIFHSYFPFPISDFTKIVWICLIQINDRFLFVTYM